MTLVWSRIVGGFLALLVTLGVSTAPTPTPITTPAETLEMEQAEPAEEDALVAELAEQESVQTAESPKAIVDPYEGWKSYTNKKWGLDFRYPPGWQLVSPIETPDEWGGKLSLQVGLTSRGADYDIQVVSGNDNFQPPESWLASLKPGRNFSHYEFYDTIGGALVKKSLNYGAGSDSHVYEGYSLIFAKGPLVYFISSMATDKIEDFREVLKMLVTSELPKKLHEARFSYPHTLQWNASEKSRDTQITLKGASLGYRKLPLGFADDTGRIPDDQPVYSLTLMVEIKKYGAGAVPLRIKRLASRAEDAPLPVTRRFDFGRGSDFAEGGTTYNQEVVFLVSSEETEFTFETGGYPNELFTIRFKHGGLLLEYPGQEPVRAPPPASPPRVQVTPPPEVEVNPSQTTEAPKTESEVGTTTVGFTCTMKAQPALIARGGNTEFVWSSIGAATASSDGVPVQTSGSLLVENITQRVIKKVVFYNGEHSIECQATVIIVPTFSFPGYVSVLTPSGEIRIDRLQVGDQVFSFDIGTGEHLITTIEHMFTRQDADYIRVNRELDATDEHPFAVLSVTGAVEWRKAKDLTQGDCLVTWASVCLSVTDVRHHTGDAQKVYNMHVSGPENYYVVLDQVPILVHNKTL